MSCSKVSKTPVTLNPQLVSELKEIASQLLPFAEKQFGSDEEFGATHATEVYFTRDEDPSQFVQRMREAGFWVSGIQIAGPTYDQAAALGEVLSDIGFWISGSTINGVTTIRLRSEGPPVELVDEITELRLWAERRAEKRRAEE